MFMDKGKDSPLVERICGALRSNMEDNGGEGSGETASLSNPVMSALQYRYKCDKCSQSFSSKGSCWNHKKRVHPTDEDFAKHWHTCNQCDKSFFYKKQYDTHVEQCHASSNNSKLEDVLRCPMCSFTCFDKVDLADHVMEPHKEEDHVVDAEADSVDETVDDETMYTQDGEGQYDSELPPKTHIMYEEAVNNSILNHTVISEIEPEITQSEKGTWQCPMCPIRCTEIEDVRTHMKDRHLGKVRKHVCNICSRAFTHSSGLKQHITRVHGVPGPPPDPDGMKFFKCGLCGKAFSLVRSLISHWPTHKLQTSASLENFQCILCKAFFQLPSQLQDHFIKQHPQEATQGSVPTPSTVDKRPHPADSAEGEPKLKMEKLEDDVGLVDEDKESESSRGIPGFLSSRQCQDSFDSDDPPSNPARRVRATTSTASPHNRSSHMFHSPPSHKVDADTDERPASHISSMSGSDASKDQVVDGNEDTEPSSSQSCVNCMEKSGRLISSCKHCGIYFTDFVMHTLHMGLHGQDHPFQCHHCGKTCSDKYQFFTHIYRESHM